ncbi:DUF2058 domain-containing protein [Gammaproteobacteria bacterium]|nr:DUF2058 domain-containing protein [Gammaproteobacteria bacterium]
MSDKIAQRDAAAVVFQAEDSSDNESSDDDDFYADYKIPDDLVW